MYSEKYRKLIEGLFDILDPDQMGEEYKKALDTDKKEKLISITADHFKEKPDWEITHLLPSKNYNYITAENAKNNLMREVNINWQFTDGHIDYLFNATSVNGPLNHEWLWQLNRHGFWNEMAAAYSDTKDESYARAFRTQLIDWVDQTSPIPDFNGPGSAWRTIECGLRLMGSWMVAYSAFRKSPLLNDETILIMLASMYQQAEHLINHFTSDNWLMMETNGAYTFASLFPEFKDAKMIRSISGRKLTEELEKQLLPDGMQYELSPDYHYVVYICATNLYFIAQYLDLTEELPEAFKPLLKKAADAYIALSTPGFTQPRTNDCYTLKTSYVINRALRVFPDEANYRFVDSERKDGYAPEAETPSRFLKYAGLCAMRSGWEQDATYMCFDVGPLGMAHIHQDMLNINLYKGKQELIFDDGGGQYEISEARKYALSAADHNTVLVDGMGQNRTYPKRSEQPIDCGWISNLTFDYACGVYDGEFGSNQISPATHKRQVRFCKPDFFVIRDDLISKDGKDHDYEALFHLDTLKTEEIKQYPGALQSDYSREYDVLILPVDGNEETISVTSGQTEPYFRGWYVGRNESDLHKATTIGRKVFAKKQYTYLTLLFVIDKSRELPVIKKEKHILTVSFKGVVYRIDCEHLDR